MDYVNENRLLPSGLEKSAATENIAVKGAAVSDSDFRAGHDKVSYAVTVNSLPPYTILTELRYQPLSHGHMLDLFKLSDKVDVIEMFRTIYESTELRDEVIATDWVMAY